MKRLALAFAILIAGGVLAPRSSFAQIPPGGYVRGVQAPKRDQDRKLYENLRLSYNLGYDGPRFTNFDLTQKQGPNDLTSSFTAITHRLRIGYALSSKVVAGFQFRGLGSFDPNQGFSIGDVANYFNWSKMIETQDLELQGVLIFTYPTTVASQTKGNILSVRVQGNWNLKTSLRNWNFTVISMLTTNYTKDPVGKDEFTAALVPYFTYDIGPSVAWVFEGYFDSTRGYNAPSLDFSQAGEDSFDTGPVFTINKYTSLTSTVKFYTQNITFETATPYLELNFTL